MTEPSPRRTVLVIEDDKDIAEAIADVLREIGRDVVIARDGTEALEKLKAMEPPCLILLDLIMPGMDGFEFLKRLRAEYSPDFSVLITSAHDRLAEAAQYPGVLGTLRKPFELAELLGHVVEHC